MPIAIIKEQLKSIPKTSGVYQFFDAADNLLYVGKAKNLVKRITSYTKPNLMSPRIARMVFLTQKLQITQTSSELEALLLEHNLIKKLEPKFNILLRDDKSYAQILLTDHQFPQLTKFRGQKTNKGKYFGPFPSGLDVNRTIDILRKSFLLRNCSDNEFKSRKKPCLEYQIKRCSAPCVSMISQEDYKNSVDETIDFLNGKSREVQKTLKARMQNFSENFEYEKAASVRDQLQAIESILAKQNINVGEFKNFDTVSLVAKAGKVCVYVAFFRGGQNFGARPYFFDIEPFDKLRVTQQQNEKQIEQLLSEFLGQFYLSQTPPNMILLNMEIADKKIMEEFLTKLREKNVEIITPKKGAKMALIKDQENIATQNLEQKISQNINNEQLLLDLKNLFNLDKIPQRIEVYDNSHTSGTNAVGAMVAAGVDGFIKSGYRKFNIGKLPQKNHDDTAMMREVLLRRFSKQHAGWPDLVLIDGGKPQYSATKQVFAEMNITIPFVCIVKGENRNAGDERFLYKDEIIELPKHAPVMHYLQRLRDEAHRFAIMTHRKKRSKNTLGN